mgnify:CR=1 FL=1
MKLLIKNGRVVHPVTSVVLPQDLLIEDGKIALLERGLDLDTDRVIDARGLCIAPGLVDMHVHLRDPGLPYKEDIVTGCAAAARGGVTSMACMANTKPVLDTPEQMEYIYNRAKGGSGVQVYPIGAMRMIDGGKLDDKIIALPCNDPTYREVKSLDELPPHVFDEIMHFFMVYKQLENKQTAVKELHSAEEAKVIIKAAIDQYLEMEARGDFKDHT